MNDLDQLEAAAAAADALDSLEAPQLPETSPPIDDAEQWEGLISMIVMMAAPIAPAIPKKYTPEVIKAIGQAMVPVAEKYNWKAGSLPPEISLIILVVAPWAPEIVASMKARRERNQPIEKSIPSGESNSPETPTAPPPA